MPEENIHQRVLQIVKLKGPVVPSQISTEIGSNSLLASAILSEYVSKKQLRISKVKVGGSPLYFAPGQEEKLQNYTKYLHEKEFKAFELLKKETVLRDKALEPVTRVALREIKDFALPLEVSHEGSTEIFWKWYLLTNDSVSPKIKNILGISESKVPEMQKEIKTQEHITLPKVNKKQVQGIFRQRIIEYFEQNKIKIVETFENKKKTESEFIISVPSPVGSIKYYCKAKDKKNCNDGDLSTAYVIGQNKNLPVLFITTGKMTKKANDMLEREFSNINVKQL